MQYKNVDSEMHLYRTELCDEMKRDLLDYQSSIIFFFFGKRILYNISRTDLV